MKNHSNLSAASAEFGKIATEQKNPAAAAMAIHLAIAASEAYAAELEQRQAIAAAVTESVANKSEVTVKVADMEAAINFIHRQWVDVDFDRYPDRVTIFGSERFPVESPDSDLEGSFVLNLIFPK